MDKTITRASDHIALNTWLDGDDDDDHPTFEEALLDWIIYEC
jgi:hypothetical protein